MPNRTRCIQTCLAALLLALASSPLLRADEIVLKNGNRLHGKVLDEYDGKIVIETSAGVITLRRSLVREIVKGPVLIPARRDKEARGKDTARRKRVARRRQAKAARAKRRARTARRVRKRPRKPG